MSEAELTDDEKEKNREIAKIRVEIEHQTCGIKRCQILVQKFRNAVENYIDMDCTTFVSLTVKQEILDT
ncbi:MAG: hypothetical protein AAF652_04355 [Cyanobacteria bacterium P01_C01_bin.72]